MNYIISNNSDFLEHHGIKGMHWGIRRFQNYDGTRIGGGRNKTSNSFHNSMVGGQGGKATGTARLAASAKLPSKDQRLVKERKKAQDDIIDIMADYNASMNSMDYKSYAKNEKVLKRNLEQYYKKYGNDSIEKIDSHVLNDGSTAFELIFKGEDHGYMIWNNYVVTIDLNKKV